MLHFLINFASKTNGHSIGSDTNDCTMESGSRAFSRLEFFKLVNSGGIAFVLQNPGILRIPLDKMEAQALLRSTEAEYLDLVSSGSLPFVSVGRDYFEPLLRHHTFWDLQHCSLSFAMPSESVQKKIVLPQFLDAVAELIEGCCGTSETLIQVLAEAQEFAQKVFSWEEEQFNTPSLVSIKGVSIWIALVSEIAMYGDYCRDRMRSRARESSNGLSCTNWLVSGLSLSPDRPIPRRL